MPQGTPLNIKVPAIAEAYENQLTRQMRAVRTKQGACTDLRLNLLDDCGNPVNLEDYGFDAVSDSESSSESLSTDPYSKCRFREASGTVSTTYQVSVSIISTDPAIVQCKIPPQVMNNSGVWLAEFGILDGDDDLLFTNECYIYNEISGWGGSTVGGLPSVDTVRLSLRDSDPGLNELIDDHDYDLAEIAAAAARVVNYWNDQPPPVRRAIFSATTFPFREIWLTGMHMFLFQAAEEHYRRNVLPHSAGGTTVDDKNRHREYRQAMADRQLEFKRLVMHRKAQLNAEGGYRTLMAGYPISSTFSGGR
jgi:hypothetical protein